MQRFRRRALSLIECTVALIIVPMCVTAVALAVSTGQAEATEALVQTRAGMLAETLMEEILSKPATDPTAPDNETLRADYDDVGDYNGFLEKAGALADANGLKYASSLQRFDRAVTVTAKQLSLADLGYMADGYEVTVTVALEGVPRVTLKRFVMESMIEPEL